MNGIVQYHEEICKATENSFLKAINTRTSWPQARIFSVVFYVSCYEQIIIRFFFCFLICRSAWILALNGTGNYNDKTSLQDGATRHFYHLNGLLMRRYVM